MTGYDRRGHVQPPNGLWTGFLDADTDFESEAPLSEEAVTVRSAGCGFPMYGAPEADVLRAVVAERIRRSGSRRRPPGRDAFQNAHSELRTKGYFWVRKVTTGRKIGKNPEFAIIRSYSNEPWGHVEKLKAMPVDEVIWHYRRMKAATAHLELLIPAKKPRLRRVG